MCVRIRTNFKAALQSPTPKQRGARTILLNKIYVGDWCDAIQHIFNLTLIVDSYVKQIIIIAFEQPGQIKDQ